MRRSPVIKDFAFRDRYSPEDLRRIVEILRNPDGGCPWDIEQTHASIRKNFIEETYEACDAIDRKDDEALCEELGDVLLQVLFHARIAEERGAFNLDDVADGEVKKLVYRHPHVFSDVTVSGSDEVLSNWDVLKKAEKKQKDLSDELEAVPAAFPALMRGEKLSKRAIKAGALSSSLSETVEDCESAFRTWKANPEDPSSLGELLLSLTRAAYLADVDAEEALSFASDRFTQKYTHKNLNTEKENTHEQG